MKVRAGWTDEEWDGLLSGRPEATYFHGRAWARIVRASFPHLTDRSLWIEEEPPLLLPLFAWKRAGGLLTTLHSSFPFLYGGPVPAGASASDPQDPLERVVRWLEREHPLASLRITGNPFTSFVAATGAGAGSAAGLEAGSDAGSTTGADAVSAAGSEAASADAQAALKAPDGERRRTAVPCRLESTHLLRLPSSEEEFWDRVLTTAKRNDVRRLAKKGVTVEETRAPEAVDRVYDLYQASFSRWGGTPGMVYPRAFYHNLCRLGGDAVRFTVARNAGVIIGGTFAIRAFGKVHYLAGYFDHESRALRPNVLIQIDSIQAAIRDGFRLYDFLPSGGHETVEAFKEGLGGVRTSFPVLARSGMVHRMLGRAGS